MFTNHDTYYCDFRGSLIAITFRIQINTTYLFSLEDKIRIHVRPCNILYNTRKIQMKPHPGLG